MVLSTLSIQPFIRSTFQLLFSERGCCNGCLLYYFEITFSWILLIIRMWQPCYIAAAECYSEIIDFSQSCDLVSDCIHSWWSLWKLQQRLQSQKKNCWFFSLNLPSIPRDIPWRHWKNLLTSKRGRSGGWNFCIEIWYIWVKTSWGSRTLKFHPICKYHTILETSQCPCEALHNLIDLQGH